MDPEALFWPPPQQSNATLIGQDYPIFKLDQAKVTHIRRYTLHARPLLAITVTLAVVTSFYQPFLSGTVVEKHHHFPTLKA